MMSLETYTGLILQNKHHTCINTITASLVIIGNKTIHKAGIFLPYILHVL